MCKVHTHHPGPCDVSGEGEEGVQIIFGFPRRRKEETFQLFAPILSYKAPSTNHYFGKISSGAEHLACLRRDPRTRLQNIVSFTDQETT